MEGLRPFVGARVLEAGCGIGNLTELLTEAERLVGVDMDASYVGRLRRRYAVKEHIDFHQADLHELLNLPQLTEEVFDTVLCVNVLEHVRDDRLVLNNFAQLLQPGGRVVLQVPAHPWLYSEVDRTLGHFRRYTKQELKYKFEESGLVVERLYGFNRLGAFGWLVSGKALRARTLSTWQMQTYERIVSLAKLIERIAPLPALSLVAIGRTPR
jgi:SAM-dependent methyltransferase